MENNKFKLSGGFFLFLLLEARKEGYSRRERIQGKKSGISEGDILEGLVKIVNPNIFIKDGNSKKTNTSQYKKCKINHSSWLPFNEVSFIESFNYQIENNYGILLQRTNKFVNDNLNINNLALLRKIGKEIFALFFYDESISGDDKIYISDKGSVLKSDLTLDFKISFQELILGIWHFIISKKIDNRLNINNYNNFINYHENSYSNKNKAFFNIIIYLLGNDDKKYLTNQPVIENNNETNVTFTKYNKKLLKKYSSIKTLLYYDTPHDFDSFYECNNLILQRFYRNFGDIEIFENDENNRYSCLQNATAQKLLKTFSNFLIITGTGGLGKSMMMKHLLLEAIKSNDDDLIPVFIQLKDYNSRYNNLINFIYSKIKDINAGITKKVFINYLEEGKMLLLLDGLDEISSNETNNFINQLEKMTDSYSSNMYILSSRPYSNFICLNNFITLSLMPLTKQQAIHLINRLEFRLDEPSIKRKFIEQLEKNLYNTHKEFACNPLLLTIMLMTFMHYAEVPSKMHFFYREAYLTMAQNHDASKGAYKRILHTKLSSERFADYLAEFCMRTYVKEKYEFTYEEFNDFFTQLFEHKRNINEKISCDDFIEDLKSNICLIYEEGGKYHFIHRSFQEYFCALFFSKQKDKTLKKIGEFFQNKKVRTSSDKTFNMLYDMIPDKVDEYISLPYLDEIFNKINNEDGYFTYLSMFFDTIEYSIGEQFEIAPCYKRNSYLLDFILSVKGFIAKENLKNLPPIKQLAIEAFSILNSSTENEELISIPFDDETSTPDIIIYSFDVNKILLNKKKYEELLTALNNNDCLLKQEYARLKAFYEALKNKPNISDDFFDNFDFIKV